MSAKTPYIGSKISLISKAEIRYEGVLYAVDTKEATVTLAKVRSYGTEGRQVPKPIPPRTETYEFIIFRGSDIKDLHVSEIQSATKTEQQEDPAPQDPAIVSATSQAPVLPPPTTNEAPPPSSSASQPPLIPPFQHTTYSQFPPAPPGGFAPFNVPYFKPAVMMGAGGGGGAGRPPPNILPSHHHLPLSSHQPFPPFMPGQVPIPLSQKSLFLPPNLPSSSAPVVSTIIRPSPAGVVAKGKSQLPVASSTPQTATTESHTTGQVSNTSAQTTPRAASESESPLARMNHVSPPSPVTQAPPPSSLSHLPPSLDHLAHPSALGGQQGASQTTTAPTGSGSQHQQQTNSTLQTQTGHSGGESEDKQSLQKQGTGGGKAPLISEPPPQTVAERRNSAGSRGRERSRGRGGRRNFRSGGPWDWNRGGGPSNQHEPTYRYENDFDFESANAQFDKQVLEEEFKKLRVGSKGKSATAESGSGGGPATPTTRGSVSEEVGDVVVEEEEVEMGEVVDDDEEPEQEEFYDKTKSFFDNISCENPGGNRYANRNEERELNTETFGVSSVNSLRRDRGGRGRGRWRGGGWGRGRRGGGGYGSYYGRGGWRGGWRGGRREEGRREEGRDGGSRDGQRDDRPPRRGGGYYRSSGGYRGGERRGRGRSERGVRGSGDQPARPTTTKTATAGGDQ